MNPEPKTPSLSVERLDTAILAARANAYVPHTIALIDEIGSAWHAIRSGVILQALGTEEGGNDLRDAVIEAARDLVMKPGGLVNRGVNFGLVVVEKADKSDPHYRLCAAFERLDAEALGGKS